MMKRYWITSPCSQSHVTKFLSRRERPGEGLEYGFVQKKPERSRSFSSPHLHLSLRERDQTADAVVER
jgi:hypothetical protein